MLKYNLPLITTQENESTEITLSTSTINHKSKDDIIEIQNITQTTVVNVNLYSAISLV